MFNIRDAREVFRFINDAADPRSWTTGKHPVILHDTLRGERTRSAFEAFSMYGNPWWSRVWTIQEAILPKVAILMWGTLSIDWDLVVKASKNLRSSERAGIYSASFRVKRRIYTPLLRRLQYPMHGFRHAENDDGPLELLMRWRHRSATDPRDKVYGLGGLLPRGAVPSAEQCSYDIPTAELFQDVTVDLLMHENGLRPLIGSQEILHQTPQLASWAIDFACVNIVGKRQLKWWNHSHRYHRFTAAAGLPLQVSTSQEGKVLTLTGVFIDEILDLNEPSSVSENENVPVDRLLATLQSVRDLLNRCRLSHSFGESYVSGCSWDIAFFRTVVGDLVMKEFPVRRVEGGDEDKFNSIVGDYKLLAKLNPGSQTSVTTGNARKSPYDVFQSLLNSAYSDAEVFGLTSDSPLELHESLCGMLINHRFFVTKKGYIGIGPPNAQPGDQVWIFHGGNVPFITRKTEENNISDGHHNMLLVGDAYVHGIMDGEAMQNGPVVESVWLH